MSIAIKKMGIVKNLSNLWEECFLKLLTKSPNDDEFRFRKTQPIFGPGLSQWREPFLSRNILIFLKNHKNLILNFQQCKISKLPLQNKLYISKIGWPDEQL